MRSPEALLYRSNGSNMTHQIMSAAQGGDLFANLDGRTRNELTVNALWKN